uniref:furin n=1 Tax=Cacopsylla melanoneura TaxID=428564 RepID=A0A8D8XPL7_9HEMI
MYNTRKCFHSEHNLLTLRRPRGLVNTLTRSGSRGLFLPAVVFSVLVLCNVEAVQRTQPVFMNEFAVRIPTGDADANRIAAKHGFTNIGQIGSLKGYYLFEHQHVHKRSTTQSDTHHSLLSSEPQVDWVQQQHEKVRKKRDFTNPDFSVFGGEGDFRSLFDSNPEPRSPLIPQTSFRGFSSSSNVFPDPLFREQWYLNGGAKDGFDMNIGPAWQKGYTGKGVVVSILDDGIQTNHPDLALNYDREASIDINNNDDDPMPRDNGDNKHGTRCAGEVAAVAFNQYCGVGVAYNASIGGVRMLDGIVNDAVEARALGLNINHIDIYSASWGPEDDGRTVDGPGPLARRAFINGVTSGRHGKGSIFVWASGNGGRHIDSCNCDGYTNSIFTLSISSATQGGYRPWYLEKCSSTLSTTYSSGTPGSDKSVATVDMDGKLRPDHICTVEHTGTSASAPIAAGMCALVLEANPSLTWRDMQYIVVLTSKPGPLEKEGGWSVNGVKRRFNHNFGYGMMDGGAMVTLAEQWTNLPPQHICKSQEVNEERQIDPSYGSQLNTYMDVNACLGTLNEVRYVEHVQCKISLRFFPRGNIRILLTSPMGTTSTLLFERPRDVVSSNFDDWPFLSVHYFGEKVEGRWTLQIVNGGNRHVNQPGILKKWQLIFYGTSTNPIRLRTRNPGFQDTPFAVQPAQQRASNVPGTTVFGGFPSSGFSSFGSDLFNQPFRNLPDLFGAGSNMDVSVASLNSRSSGSGSTNPSMSLQVSGNRPIEGQQVLHDCDPECDGQGCYGKGPGQCIACKQYRLDNTCVSRCPPRSFPNQGGVCWPCHESCETCAGAGQDSCLTCAPAHLRVTDLAVCLQQCPEGYFENTEEGTCVPCEPNCASCQDRPDHCTACDHHLVLYGNKCLAACPDKTYETDDYRCAPCHNSCETCIGPAAKECVTCRSGYYELAGICYSSCPVTYYPDKKRRECRPCPSGCATCTSGGQCTSCLSDYELKSNDCIKSGTANCSPSQYWSGSACEKCHSTCGLCDGPAADSCLTCPDGKLLEASSCVSSCSKGFYQDKDNTCTPCLHTCTQCVSRINCTMCTLPLVLQSGQCRATCANGYYSDLGACSKCYLSCMTCAGPRRDQCVTCPRGWQLAGGECHPECPTGFFMSDFGCQKCHHYCRTCKGEGPLQCTSCPTHFMLDGGLCMECLGSQYYDPPTQLCKSCHSSCRSCSGPGPFSCTSCNYPLHLDKLNNQCVPCCSKYNTGGDCCACDVETGECHNASPAGKRRIAGMAPPDNNMDSWNPTPAPLQGILITPAALSLVSGLAVVILILVVILVMIRFRPNRKYGEYEKVPVFTSSSPNDERDAESRNLFTTT